MALSYRANYPPSDKAELGYEEGQERPARVDLRTQLNDLTARVSLIEIEQARHMAKTQLTIDNSRELLDTFNAFKGVWIVLNGIGKLAKPITAILSLGGAWWFIKDHMKDFFK